MVPDDDGDGDVSANDDDDALFFKVDRALHRCGLWENLCARDALYTHRCSLCDLLVFSSSLVFLRFGTGSPPPASDVTSSGPGMFPSRL